MNPERASLKVNVISVVLNVDQLPNDFIPVLYHTRPQGNHHVLIVNRAAESVDAGHTRHDDDVFSFGQCRCG